MAYRKLDIKDLMDVMGKSSSSILNYWDIVGAYDVQAVNEIFLEEYVKYPGNSKLYFNSTKTIIGHPYHIDCEINLGLPTLSFSPVQTGIYDLEIPIESNSFCNEIFGNLSEKKTIPENFKIVASGPLGTIKRINGDQEFFNSDETVALDDKARIVLHFGKKIKSVSILPQAIPEEYQQILDELVKNFKTSIQEINYDLFQIIKNGNVEDQILTPKSFVFTTTADEQNKELGVLNIWIQTHESGRPQGNPQPSFYPDAAILPIPIGHASNIIFDHRLINEKYLQPALSSFYDVAATLHGKGAFVEHFSLIPKDLNKRSFNVSLDGIDSRKTDYEVNFESNPFMFNIHNEKVHWMWQYETYVRNIEMKMVNDEFFGDATGIVVGESVAYFIKGPAHAFPNGGLYSNKKEADKVKKALTAAINETKKFIKLKANVHKEFGISAVDETKFTSKIELIDKDIGLKVDLEDLPGVELLPRKDYVINWEEMQARFSSKLQNSIFYPVVDLESLRDFARNNILLNDARFGIDQKRAFYIPYDTAMVGDIVFPDKLRHKRNQETVDEFIQTYSASSSSKPSSPINSAINWIKSSLEQMKSFNPFGMFNHNQQLLVSNKAVLNATSPTKIASFDVNSALILGDLAIRSFTKAKPYYASENIPSFMDAKTYALNLITKFEETLKAASPEDLEFDPITLMSKIEKEVINGNHEEIAGILQQGVSYKSNSNGFNLEEMIDDILGEHDEEFLGVNALLEKTNVALLQNNLNVMFCK